MFKKTLLLGLSFIILGMSAGYADDESSDEEDAPFSIRVNATVEQMLTDERARQAESYYYGADGEVQDYRVAVALAQKAADGGSQEAKWLLSQCYNNGHGVKKDEACARRLAHEAAADGCLEAQYQLGRWYYEGKMVKQSYKQAFEWYHRAAKGGYADAQYMLARCYRFGEGVQESGKEAMRWCGLSAEQGHPGALIALASACLDGKGVPRNEERGERLLILLRHEGNLDAQHRLGLYYQKRGDYVRAIEVLSDAAAKGYDPSRISLMFMPAPVSIDSRNSCPGGP